MHCPGNRIRVLKHLIELVFQPIVGLQLSDMWRYVGSQRFEIGPKIPTQNRKGRRVWKADIALVVSSYWDITGPDGHIVGSRDFGPDDERRDSDEAHALYRLLQQDRIWIRSVEGRTDGGFHLHLNYGFVLTSLPPPHEHACISADEVKRRKDLFCEGELWRFMPNFITVPDAGHFVGTPEVIFSD